MLLLSDWHSFPRDLQGGVLCVGNFDGVHIGHAGMLSTGSRLARERGIPFTIMTFDPHPSLVLKPHSPRPPLTTPEQRRDLLARHAPDVLLTIPTTREFLAITAEEFLRKIVRGDPADPHHEGIGATLLVEGNTFTFGRGAGGDIDTLRQLGPTMGFQAMIIPTQEVRLSDLTVANVSSTMIRWLLGHGRVADAQSALGRPYALRGTVVEGARRGRTIGFPTANIQTPQLVPAAGVYAGHVQVGAQRHLAAISVGTNPTFAGENTTVEAFLLDFSGDLYGQVIEIEFHRWVREMITYSGVGPLVAQMNRDVAWTRQALAHAS